MAGPDMLSEQGTALASALRTSRELLQQGAPSGPGSSFQAILLVTDGEDLEGDWEKEARACIDAGIRIIPVGVGEESGGLIPVLDAQGRPGGFLKDEQDNVVLTRLDLVALEKLASFAGGSSFRIGVDGLAGDRLFTEMQRLGRREFEERSVSAYQERYAGFLFLAGLSLILRLLLHARVRSVPSGSTALVVFLVVGCLLAGWVGPSWAGLRPPGAGALEAGRQKYEAGDFAGALAEFEKASVESPQDPVVGLALGEALFHLERHDEAAAEFSRVLGLTDDPDLRAEAFYNSGTARLAAGDPAQAAELLRSSLALEPGQEDALFNLEVALRLLAQNQQQQDQQQQDQQQQDQQQQDQQQQDQQQQDQQQQDQQQQDQEQQDQEQQDQEQQDQEQQDQEQQDQEQEQDQEQPQEQDQPGEAGNEPETTDTQELTHEQALQILQALDRDEEELKRSVQKRLKGGRPRSGKKW
jgi:Ca-activated chloride channel family protein